MEDINPHEVAWVCLQCGACRYARKEEAWPFASESSPAAPMQEALK